MQNYQVKEDESESTGDSEGTTEDEDTADESKEEGDPPEKIEAIVLKEAEEDNTSGGGETTSDEVEMSEEEKEREVKVGSRKMERRPRRAAKEKKKEDLSEEPDWQSSLVPRRSLRKVIEESKKDAEAVQTPKQKVRSRASQSAKKQVASEAAEMKSSKRSSSVKSREKLADEKKPAAEEKKEDRSCSSGRRKIFSRGRRSTRKNKTPSRAKTNEDCENPESGRSLDRITRNLTKELDYDNEDTDIDEIHPPKFADSRSGSPASKSLEKEKEEAAEKSSTKCTPMDTEDQSANDNQESPMFKTDASKLTDKCADILEKFQMKILTG